MSISGALEVALQATGWLKGGAPLQKALADVQSWLGRPATGQPDLDTLAYLEEPRFCGHPDHMPLIAEARRQRSDVLWRLQGSLAPVVADSDFRASLQTAFDSWALAIDCSGREARPDERPDLIVTAGRIDRVGNVLAWCELPSQGQDRTQQMKVDTSEQWIIRAGLLPDLSRIDLGRVLEHELGHFWGLVHSSDRESLMFPTVSRQIDGPRESDFRAMEGLGYRRRSGPPPRPPEPPAPPPGGGEEPIVIRIWGARRIEVPGYQVTRLQTLEGSEGSSPDVAG